MNLCMQTFSHRLSKAFIYKLSIKLWLLKVPGLQLFLVFLNDINMVYHWMCIPFVFIFLFYIICHLFLLEQNISGLIQCAVQHKKIVQNNEVVTFSQWMVIRLNDEEGGMKDHQTIIIIYSQLLKLSRVKSNFHFWRPPKAVQSACDKNLPLPNFPETEKLYSQF